MHQLYYASYEINRQGDYRSDKKLIEKILLDENTKFIPHYQGKNLFQETKENIEAIKLNNKQLKIFFPKGIKNPIYLGVDNETNYFGLDLSNQNSNIDLWLKDNKVIVEDLRKYGPSLNDIDASFLALTNGMFFWHKTHQFCGSCGFKNISKDGGFVKICSNDKCGKSHFPRTDPAIITLISF